MMVMMVMNSCVQATHLVLPDIGSGPEMGIRQGKASKLNESLFHYVYLNYQETRLLPTGYEAESISARVGLGVEPMEGSQEDSNEF